MSKSFLFLCSIVVVFTQMQAQTWTQKANFPGAGRYNVVSFSIGDKGYIGLGNNTGLTEFTDFWEWSQASNSWLPISGFPGAAKVSAASFSIEKKGYVVTGYGSGHTTNELWEWDGDVTSSTYNTWTRKADFPGPARVKAVAFSINKKGYVSTGSYNKDLWEWNGDPASPTYNTWIQKADFGGGDRGWAIGFSCGLKAYVGLGTDGIHYRKDFWEWDGDFNSPTYNSWVQLPNFPGDSRSDAIGISIGSKGYVGLGIDSTSFVNSQSFWEWDPMNYVWTQKMNFAGTGRQSLAAFTIGNKAYVGVGYDNTNTTDFWEYCDTCNIVTATKTYPIKEIQIYPNPADDKLHLYNVPPGKEPQITLWNVAGEEVTIQKINTHLINVSSVSEGLFFLRVETNEGTQIKKLLIRR